MSSRTPTPHPTRITVRDVAPKHDTAVTGGKAGSDPSKYMDIKLKEVLISGVATSGGAAVTP